MIPKRNAVVSALICDDVRREINGKEILIGVYTRPYIVPQLPFKLIQLVVRMEMFFDGDKVDLMELRLQSPPGKIIYETSGPIPFTDWDDYGSVSVSIPGLEFDESGLYKIELSFGKEWFLIREIEVRTQAAHIRRLQQLGILPLAAP
jgi:hypothetical protein